MTYLLLFGLLLACTGILYAVALAVHLWRDRLAADESSELPPPPEPFA